jgi:hypothetical protein
MSRSIGVAMALALLATLVCGGCQADQKYSQTELNALQTREFDAPFDRAFDGAVGALFDLGYTIFTSDKRGGLLSASGGRGSVQVKLDQLGPSKTSVRVSTLQGGQARVDKERIDELLNTIDRRLLAHAGGA